MDDLSKALKLYTDDMSLIDEIKNQRDLQKAAELNGL